MIRTTDYLLHAKISYIGVFNDCIIIAGDSNIINMYSCINKDEIEEMTQLLFTDQPHTLMVDGKVSYGQFNSYGFEGIVSTIESTIWYVNFQERACIRVLDTHFLGVNDMDILNIVGRTHMTCTCSDDNTIRV